MGLFSLKQMSIYETCKKWFTRIGYCSVLDKKEEDQWDQNRDLGKYLIPDFSDIPNKILHKQFSTIMK